jgi:hypothetical protein
MAGCGTTLSLRVAVGGGRRLIAKLQRSQHNSIAIHGVFDRKS